MNEAPMISVRNVAKHFSIPRRKDETLLSQIVHGFSAPPKHPAILRKHALRDVNLSVARGEVCGIVGANSSGKTTLLRMIAGILEPDAGTVLVRGTVTALINLTVGIKEHLTVRDNIYLTCALFGMSRTETKQRFPGIVEFGELEEYVDMFPYQLSSGMNQRLAFSIAVHAEPKILLLDEVFSAGDIRFRQKAAERMRLLISGDVTVVMASHDMEQIRTLSDNVLWLSDGSVRMYGKPDEVVDAYVSSLLSRQQVAA